MFAPLLILRSLQHREDVKFWAHRVPEKQLQKMHRYLTERDMRTGLALPLGRVLDGCSASMKDRRLKPLPPRRYRTLRASSSVYAPLR